MRDEKTMERDGGTSLIQTTSQDLTGSAASGGRLEGGNR
jgi:hypothetical protein